MFCKLQVCTHCATVDWLVSRQELDQKAALAILLPYEYDDDLLRVLKHVQPLDDVKLQAFMQRLLDIRV